MKTYILNALYRSARPFLFRLQPEAAHELILAFLKATSFFLPEYHPSKTLKQKLFFKELKTPVGLAAGFDKYGDVFPFLDTFGFGCYELGSFTQNYQAGNPKPRIKRYTSQKALVNKMGFNNPGIEQAMKNIRQSFSKFREKPPLIGVSLGKSKNTRNQDVLKEYLKILECIQKAENQDIFKRILYVALNISSPNTPNLRKLQNRKDLVHIIGSIKQTSGLPLLIKFAPSFEEWMEFERLLEATALAGADGFILVNTSTDYRLLKDHSGLKDFGGGISGEPLKKTAETYLKKAYDVLDASKVIISSGGVMSPQDVWRRLVLGSSLVQVYTGFIYYGPAFLFDSFSYILKELKRYGFLSLDTFFENRKYIQKEIFSSKTI